MVLLIITPTIVSALERLPESSREQLGLPAPQLNEPISHDQLITLSRKLSSCSFEDKGTSQTDAEDQTPSYTLNDLVRGTSVYIPPPAPKPEPVYTAPFLSNSSLYAYKRKVLKLTLYLDARICRPNG